VNGCPRAGTRRFEVSTEGVVEVGVFLARTITPGQEIALCRQHLRSMSASLELEAVNLSDENPA
jgi:hypothetical protein